MLQRNYHKIHNRFRRHAPPLIYNNVFRHRQIVKYLIAGGTSTSADILIYSMLVYFAGLWYVTSSVISFTIAFWISFGLQKFWTFRDKNTEKLMKQTYLYFFVAIANLGMSTLLIYIFVDYAHIHKFLSKIFANIIIAAESFFVYRHFIFSKKDIIENVEVRQETNMP